MIEINLKAHSYPLLINACEATIYNMAYKASQYNQSLAAKLLGVSRTTFRTKMKKHYNILNNKRVY